MKTSKSALCAVVVLMLGFSVAVSPQQAFARSQKIHPGTMCVKLPGGANIGRAFGRTITNTSTGAHLIVQCDIVNELDLDVAPPFSSRIINGRVLTTDRHPTDDITCALIQASRGIVAGQTVYRATYRNTTGVDDLHLLIFPPPDPDGITGFVSNKFFLCRIPPAFDDEPNNPNNALAVSELHNYQILEGQQP